MSNAPEDQVTHLLHEWNAGNNSAPEKLLPLIYEHLRGMARDQMRHERDGHTLQPTALVHEAFLRMSGGTPVQWQDRAHFYSLAARAMRRILVDHARSRARAKRGGVQQRVSLTEAAPVQLSSDPDEGSEVNVAMLDQALHRLTESFPRQGQVVELRFFGGMESRDIAEVLKVSEKTILRDWQFAKLWLQREIGQAVT